ncbi:MAG: hypothetical protein AAGF12_24150 [Myxococcota bacterium]
MRWVLVRALIAPYLGAPYLGAPCLAAACLGAACLVAGCQADIPDNVYVCALQSDCPPGLVCDLSTGLCARGATGCRPVTCEFGGWNCGSRDDGCGGVLECGRCEAPDVCGAVFPNLCSCVPETCEELGAECGPQDDGCGGMIPFCGACDAPAECDGARCACTPRVCQPNECGMPSDGCGAILDCGGCAAPTPNCGLDEMLGYAVCSTEACIPKTVDEICIGGACGRIGDGCGGTVNCRGCPVAQTCGGGGVENMCGCTPRTCDAVGAECGSIDQRCGLGTVVCPNTCGDQQACNNSNRCVCADDKNEPNDAIGDATGVTLAGLASVAGRISSRTDVDRYVLPLSTSTELANGVGIRLANIPAGNAYFLNAYLLCGGPAASLDCSGAPFPPGGIPGADAACTTGAVTGTGALTIEASCPGPSLSSRLVLEVLAGTWTDACENYSLTGSIGVPGLTN